MMEVQLNARLSEQLLQAGVEHFRVCGNVTTRRKTSALAAFGQLLSPKS